MFFAHFLKGPGWTFSVAEAMSDSWPGPMILVFASLRCPHVTFSSHNEVCTCLKVCDVIGTRASNFMRQAVDPACFFISIRETKFLHVKKNEPQHSRQASSNLIGPGEPLCLHFMGVISALCFYDSGPKPNVENRF